MRKVIKCCLMSGMLCMLFTGCGQSSAPKVEEDKKQEVMIDKEAQEKTETLEEKQEEPETEGTVKKEAEKVSEKKEVKDSKKPEKQSEKKPSKKPSKEPNKEQTAKPDKKPSSDKKPATTDKKPTQEKPKEEPKVEHVHHWEIDYKTVVVPAKTHVVHHKAEYKTVHHDAVTHVEPIYEAHQICNDCGMDFGTNVDAAIDHLSLDGCQSYSSTRVQVGTKTVVDKEAYDEKVLVKDAYDEVVVDVPETTKQEPNGYVCSGCGVKK